MDVSHLLPNSSHFKIDGVVLMMISEFEYWRGFFQQIFSALAAFCVPLSPQMPVLRSGLELHIQAPVSTAKCLPGFFYSQSARALPVLRSLRIAFIAASGTITPHEKRVSDCSPLACCIGCTALKSGRSVSLASRNSAWVLPVLCACAGFF